MYLAENACLPAARPRVPQSARCRDYRRGTGIGRRARHLAQRHHFIGLALSEPDVRNSAARFSFLLSTPAIAAAACQGALRPAHREIGPPRDSEHVRLVVGVAVSAVTGCSGHLLGFCIICAAASASVCVLPHYFWHNSACSGFHPPASVMKLLSPTQHRTAERSRRFLLLSLGLVMLLSLVSYHTQDPSFDTAAEPRPSTWSATPAPISPTCVHQMFGAAAFSLSRCCCSLLAWKWIRSEDIGAGGVPKFSAPRC